MMSGERIPDLGVSVDRAWRYRLGGAIRGGGDLVSARGLAALSVEQHAAWPEARGNGLGRGKPAWQRPGRVVVLSARAYAGCSPPGARAAGELEPALSDRAAWSAGRCRPVALSGCRGELEPAFVGLVRVLDVGLGHLRPIRHQLCQPGEKQA